MKKQKKEKEITLKQAFLNNIYAIKLLYKISRRRVIHMFVRTFTGYMCWMFFSNFYIRYIAENIQRVIHHDASPQPIFMFIGSVCGIMLLFHLHDTYVKNVIEPLDDVKVYSKLYKEIYRKAENVELACYEDSKFYDKYTMAIDNSAQKITETVGLLFEIFSALIAASITYVSMSMIDARLIIFVLAPIIGNFVFGAILNKSKFKMYKESTPFVRRTEYVNRVMYLADYSKEMRLSNIYNLLESTYTKAAKNRIKIIKKYCLKHIINAYAHHVLSYTAIFEGILIFGAYCALVEKSMSLSEYAVITSMMGLASWAIINTSNNLLKCNQNGLFLDNLRSFLQYEEKIPEDFDGIIPDRNIDSIEFRNVSFEYKKDEPVIKNLSFTLSGRSSVALVGHNGAGKSTIIKLLFRLYDPLPDGGEILVNNINIKEYNLKAYRELFAAAFQDYKIFAATVKDNILLGREVLLGRDNLHENPEEVVRRALTSARVMDKVETLPGEIEAILTKEFEDDGQVLSGGEFQKIVVARAFANPAPIKVFDEPSSALDPIAEYELFESILEESRNHFMVFISHRLSSVKNADEVLMLENGEIIERGTHAELMELGEKYADMFNKQAMNYQPDKMESEVPA